MSAFWWGAFLRRHQALGVTHGAFAEHTLGGAAAGNPRSRRPDASSDTLGVALKGSRRCGGPRERRAQRRQAEVDARRPSSRDAEVGGRSQRAAEQARAHRRPRSGSAARARSAGLRSACASSSTRVEGERHRAELAGNRRRALTLSGGRAARIEARAPRGARCRARSRLRGRRCARRPATTGLADERTHGPGRRSRRQDPLAGVANSSPLPPSIPSERRRARLSVDRELAVLRERLKAEGRSPKRRLGRDARRPRGGGGAQTLPRPGPAVSAYRGQAAGSRAALGAAAAGASALAATGGPGGRRRARRCRLEYLDDGPRRRRDVALRRWRCGTSRRCTCACTSRPRPATESTGRCSPGSARWSATTVATRPVVHASRGPSTPRAQAGRCSSWPPPGRATASTRTARDGLTAGIRRTRSTPPPDYLRASGAPGDYARAIFAYNHARWYVEEVETWAPALRGRDAGAEPFPPPRSAEDAGSDSSLADETTTPVVFIAGAVARLDPADGHVALIPLEAPRRRPGDARGRERAAGPSLRARSAIPTRSVPPRRTARAPSTTSSTARVSDRSAEIVRDNPLAQDYVDWGPPGAGRWVTIYATDAPTPHVFMVIAGICGWTRSTTAPTSAPTASRTAPAGGSSADIPTWAHWSVRHPPGL